MQGLLLTAALIASFIPQRIVYEFTPPAHALIIVRDAEPDAEITEEVEVLDATTTSVYCSCIETLRAIGIPIPPHTDADELIPNTAPFVGAVALFSYPKGNHATLVRKAELNGFWAYGGNFKNCEKEDRFVRWDDPRLKGYWSVHK